MKNIRTAFSTAVALLLFVGYLASVFSVFNETQSDYGAKVDQPPVVFLALAILVLAVILAFMKESDEKT